MNHYLLSPPQHEWVSSSGDCDFWSIIEANIKQPWNWYKLASLAPYTSWSFISKHIDYSWNYKWLSHHPQFPLATMYAHKDKSWHVPNLLFEKEDEFDGQTSWFALLETWVNAKCKWDWPYLTMHSAISVDKIIEHKEMPWDWSRLHAKSGFEISRHLEQCPDVDWNWSAIHEFYGHNYNIWLMIRKNPTHAWNWKSIVKEFGVNWQVVEEISDAIESLCWHWFSHVMFDLRLLSVFIDKPWNFQIVTKSMRNLLSMNLIAAHPMKDWDWNILSKRRDLSWYLVSAFPEKSWCWEVLARRKDINWNILKVKDVERQWKWSLSKLPRHVMEQYWLVILQSSKRKRVREIRDIAARKIQNWWLNKYYSPTSSICQHRLVREFAKLQEI